MKQIEPAPFPVDCILGDRCPCRLVGSPRPRQAFHLLLAGDSEKQVARALGASIHTAHVYIKQVYRRFGAHSRGELMSRAMGMIVQEALATGKSGHKTAESPERSAERLEDAVAAVADHVAEAQSKPATKANLSKHEPEVAKEIERLDQAVSVLAEHVDRTKPKPRPHHSPAETSEEAAARLGGVIKMLARRIETQRMRDSLPHLRAISHIADACKEMM